MSLGPDSGNPSGMLASRADRDATQAALENAFADERLTQDEFESRVGRALSARTLGDLAELTRDLPVAPGQPPAPGQYAVPGSFPGSGPFPGPGPARRPGRRAWWLVSGIAAAVVAVVIGLATVSSTGGTSQQASAAPAIQSVPAAAPSSGPARCPVGTSATARKIANALATDPLYVDTPSKQVSARQARRIRARIASADPGRIKVAAITTPTLHHGGGARNLANSIAGCAADSAGTVLVATTHTGWVATTYAHPTKMAQAVQSALNSRATLGAGLLDSVGRIALIDPRH